VTDAIETLRSAHSVLVIDWPSPDVPESLARAGFQVIVKGGPGPRDYAVRELVDGELVARALGEVPSRIDLVYAHRPEPELAAIVAGAKQLGARTLWWQSGLSGPVGAGGPDKDPKGVWVEEEQSRRIRALAESEGLAYVDDVYIADAVRELSAR
jgi:predicted CoA-binding protein